MDFFSHGIWGYILFYRTKKPIYALLCALIPDTFSWLIYFFYRIFTVGFSGGGKPDLAIIPDWVFTLYGISHSLIVAGIIILIIYLVCGKLSKNFPIYILAWPIAILMDIPTHSRDFLPTPFLWPISEWTFPGFGWGNGKFMITNLILIIICLTYVIWWRRKNKKRIDKL